MPSSRGARMMAGAGLIAWGREGWSCDGKGHKNSGSQAPSLKIVPSMGFQPRSPSLKVSSYLLWGPLKKEIYTQPIGTLMTTPCISGDLGFYIHMWSGGSPDFRNEKYVVWTGPASSLNCPACLLLEFQSIGNDSSIALPWGHPSDSCLNH